MAPMPCFAISVRAFSMRARNSGRPIGLTSSVIDFSPAVSSAANNRSGRRAASPAAAAPIINTSRRFMSARLVRLVRLLFDDGRAQQRIDALLDGGALVVGDVHRARELDELLAEPAGALLVADVV